MVRPLVCPCARFFLSLYFQDTRYYQVASYKHMNTSGRIYCLSFELVGNRFSFLCPQFLRENISNAVYGGGAFSPASFVPRLLFLPRLFLNVSNIGKCPGSCRPTQRALARSPEVGTSSVTHMSGRGKLNLSKLKKAKFARTFLYLHYFLGPAY